MLEKLQKDIDLSREVLSSLPTNNEKNKKQYLEELEKTINYFENQKNILYEELEKRIDPYLNIKPTDYQELENGLKSFATSLSYTNNLNTPYEKLKIDKIIFSLSNMENIDFDRINRQIQSFINIFTSSGISLDIHDFNYTNFVQKYMESFFEYKDDLKNENLKKAFEEIYWKCPNLVLELELNLRYLYLKNTDKLKKYCNKINQEILTRFKEGDKNLIEDYSYLRKKEAEAKFNDKNNLMYEFINGQRKIDDYTEDKIQKIEDSLTKEVSENLTEKLLKLKNSLEEYKHYLKYHPLIDNIKNLYTSTLDKKFLQTSFKKINTKEAKMFKLNKKAMFSNKKTKVDKYEMAAENIIKEIKEVYDEIDSEMFKIVVKESLEENSTIFKALLMSCQYYTFTAKYFIKENSDLFEEELNNQINELYKFVLNPFNNLINNITFLEDADLSQVITSNYRMFNINITKEMLDEENLDSLIENIDKVLIYYQLKNLNISHEELKNIEIFKNIKAKIKE